MDLLLVLAGVALILVLLRSWYVFRAQPARTSTGLGLFHVVRFAAAVALVVAIVVGFRAGR